MNVLLADGSLDGKWMVDIDRSGAGVRTQLKRSILGKPQRDATRPGMQRPLPGRISIGPDAATAGFGLDRAAHVAQFHVARASLSPYRPLRGLLQREVSTAGLPIEAASHAFGADRAAAGMGIDAAFGSADLDVP